MKYHKTSKYYIYKIIEKRKKIYNNFIYNFEDEKFNVIVKLVAQTSVSSSMQNFHSYIDSNLVGFINILEGCRDSQVKHLVFISSSWGYGDNTKIILSIGDNVDYPISLYADSKKSNELMAHTYKYLYRLPTNELRLFTFYGIFQVHPGNFGRQSYRCI